MINKFNVKEVVLEEGSFDPSQDLDGGVIRWRGCRISQCRLNPDGSMSLAIFVQHPVDESQVTRLRHAQDIHRSDIADVLRAHLRAEDPVKGERNFLTWFEKEKYRWKR